MRSITVAYARLRRGAPRPPIDRTATRPTVKVRTHRLSIAPWWNAELLRTSRSMNGSEFLNSTRHLNRTGLGPQPLLHIPRPFSRLRSTEPKNRTGPHPRRGKVTISAAKADYVRRFEIRGVHVGNITAHLDRYHRSLGAETG